MHHSGISPERSKAVLLGFHLSTRSYNAHLYQRVDYTFEIGVISILDCSFLSSDALTSTCWDTMGNVKYQEVRALDSWVNI